jgi:DNA-binding NtrC family response regulator
MEAAVVLTRFDHVTEHDLPATDPGQEEPMSVDEFLPLEVVERDHVMSVLSDTGGNKSRAAKILGLDRKTLSRKVKAYGVQTVPTPAPSNTADRGPRSS